MRLDRLDNLPPRLLDIDVREISRIFPTPTLISLAGIRSDPLFLSVLLHGNETTSFRVLRELANRYQHRRLPRSLLIFVGNVRAAAAGVRFLADQPDFNRIWRGGDDDYADLARAVLSTARGVNVFASIDIHNNTGANPHYACVASLRPADLQLAAMFATIGVFYHNPSTTQSIAFSTFCPALTIECGRNDDCTGTARAVQLVEDVMRLDRFLSHPPSVDALRLYETVGRVVIDPAMSFGETEADLMLRSDLESVNFKETPAGLEWAKVRRGARTVRVLNEHGDDLTGEFFVYAGDALVMKRTVTPSMITLNRTAIRQDCLCYLMTPCQC